MPPIGEFSPTEVLVVMEYVPGIYIKLTEERELVFTIRFEDGSHGGQWNRADPHAPFVARAHKIYGPEPFKQEKE